MTSSAAVCWRGCLRASMRRPVRCRSSDSPRRCTTSSYRDRPGRSAVLFAGLLWLADRHRRPIRLLEVGASAGLNLLADRYAYATGGHVLGDPASPLRFTDPWVPPPAADLAGAAEALRIVARAGCD